jgi:NAD(P)-dependent dehydrogenase (short-subunit alcohol dehydrogenase family)
VVALMASLERDLRLAGSPVRASVLCPGPINTNIVASERNRPAESAAQHVETEPGRKFWDILTKSLSQGMNPDDVGPMVLDAVVNEKFWVLTHPELTSWVTKQSQQMVTDRSLTR